MSESVVRVRDLHTRLGGAWIHRGLDLDIARGEVVALVGGSGSGKTTLLRELIGLGTASRGSVELFGQPLASPDPIAARALRRRFGVLFQHGALFSAFSVYDNIAFPMRELQLLDEDLIRELVLLKLAMVELQPRHAPLMPAELSGGMVKRVALARALALEPELLLLDEPTAGLDPDRSAAFVHLVKLLHEQLGLTVVFVTHDLDTLAALATRVAVLAEKRILAHGSLDEIVTMDHPFIRNFFAPGMRVRGPH
ncbi:MAG: ATP-binding cassette domain-containing protein [Rhodocyclaceae bacterium]|nr:ATP-binding cassette domain-containing protein [Rhodocyclaceae bacterium]MBX3670580.1 ATP-binding cassette domain-containing protein [Rhodocyclaceae bacterium]